MFYAHLILNYREELGEAYDGDIAFASSLEMFGGGHNDPVGVAFGGVHFSSNVSILHFSYVSLVSIYYVFCLLILFFGHNYIIILALPRTLLSKYIKLNSTSSLT